MTGFVMFLHAVVVIFLIIIILMQSGRGGGLTEGFAGAESIFGAKTNEFMIKATTIFAVVFLTTCLGLAVLSAQKGKSLMSDQGVPSEPMGTPAATTAPTAEEAVEETTGQVNTMEEKAAGELPPEVSEQAAPETLPATATP